MHGYVELLLGGEPGPLTETQERFLRIIRRNNARLLGLIEEMLLLAEAESGELALRREPVDLRTVVSEAIESAKAGADAKDIELSTETHGPVLVDGDRGRLAEIADNLISNAVKYTPVHGRVVLRVQGDHDEARFGPHPRWHRMSASRH